MTAPSPMLVDRPGTGNGVGPADDLLAGVPLRSRLKRVTGSLDRTPGKLWAARTVVVVVLLATVIVGVVSALAEVGVVRRIQTRSEPLSAAVIQAYRELADADATVAAEFRSTNDADIAASRLRYSEDLDRATKALVDAGTLAGEASLRAERLDQISRELVTYNGLVERARKAKELDRPAAEDLRQASDVMRSTILRLSETLQRTESARLDGEYRDAMAWPGAALAFTLVSLGLLLGLQLFLFVTTRRILNVGLVVATAAVLGGALWWTASLSASSSHLENARRHSQAVTDALGEAQIAARQARATELLLQVPGSGASKRNFADKAELLVRIEAEVQGTAPNDEVVFRSEGRDLGTGGALGVARQLARSTEEREAVEGAITEAAAWLNAHGRNNVQAGQAFNALDETLTKAIGIHDEAFEGNVRQSADALGGFPVGTAALGLLATAMAAWGITLRMKEYR